MSRKHEPAKPGTTGHLHVSAVMDGERVELEGDYCYLGQLANGILAFLPAPAPQPVFVHAAEIVTFRPEP